MKHHQILTTCLTRHIIYISMIKNILLDYRRLKIQKYKIAVIFSGLKPILRRGGCNIPALRLYYICLLFPFCFFLFSQSFLSSVVFSKIRSLTHFVASFPLVTFHTEISHTIAIKPTLQHIVVHHATLRWVQPCTINALRDTNCPLLIQWYYCTLHWSLLAHRITDGISLCPFGLADPISCKQHHRSTYLDNTFMWHQEDRNPR